MTVNVFRHDDEWGPYFQAVVGGCVLKCRDQEELMWAVSRLRPHPKLREADKEHLPLGNSPAQSKVISR